jgi:hypothetical protein
MKRKWNWKYLLCLLLMDSSSEVEGVFIVVCFRVWTVVGLFGSSLACKIIDLDFWWVEGNEMVQVMKEGDEIKEIQNWFPLQKVKLACKRVGWREYEFGGLMLLTREKREFEMMELSSLSMSERIERGSCWILVSACDYKVKHKVLGVLEKEGGSWEREKWVEG